MRSIPPSTAPSLRFLRWLCRFLFRCQFPASSYDRHCAALEIFRVVLAVFRIRPADGLTSASSSSSVLSPESQLWQQTVLSPLCTVSSVCTLFCGIGRAWQTVRWLSYRSLLSSFAAPLPGFASFAAVHSLLRWSLSLSASPRARESEAGALALKLLFNTYVRQLRWSIPLHRVAQELGAADADCGCDDWGVAGSSQAAVLYFLSCIRQLLRSQLSRLLTTPLTHRYTVAHGRLHGVVLLFRLVIEEVQWEGWDASENSRRQWAELVDDMLRLLTDIAVVSLKLHIPRNAFQLMQAALRAQRQSGNGDAAAAGEDERQQDSDGEAMPPLASLSLADDGSLSALRSGEEDEESAEGIEGVDCRGHVVVRGSGLDGLAEHLIVVSSWLAIKEVALALGSWVKVAPLEGECGGVLLSLAQLQAVGSLLLSVLSHSLHNGVLENTHAALLQVCERLLSASEPHRALVQGWLDALLQRIANPDDASWLRRSRGNAFALLAVLKGQPLHSAPSLLPQAVSRLLSMADASTSPSPASPLAWKRVVQGLNLLRCVFRDSALGLDCLPHVSSALQQAVLGFSHPVWAVRNSAFIAFVPIALKAIRAQYSAQLEDRGGGMTGSELFSHHPELLPFLQRQLTEAVEAGHDSAQPKLYPLLLLLSRLRPESGEEGETAATAAFLSCLQPLYSHPQAHVRRIAAKAALAMTGVQQRQAAMTGLLLSIPPVAPAAAAEPLDLDELDGRLLRLQCLFSAWSAQPAEQSGEQRDAFSLALVSLLLQRRWLASAALPVPALRLAFLSLLSAAVHSLSAAALQRSPSLLPSLLQVAAVCCDPAPELEFPGIGYEAMRAQAAAIITQTMLSLPLTGDEQRLRAELTAALIALMRDRQDTVRDGAMRVFHFAVTHSRQAAAVRVDLAAVSAVLLTELTSFSPSSRSSTRAVALQLLLALEEGASSSSLCEDAVWSKLLRCVEEGELDSCVAALPCLGRSLRGCLLAETQPACLYERCADWLRCLSRLCSDEQVPPLRYACCCSVDQSGLMTIALQRSRHRQPHVRPAVLEREGCGLMPSSRFPLSCTADVSFCLWQLLLRLLSDESQLIRQQAAALAARSTAPQLRLCVAVSELQTLDIDSSDWPPERGWVLDAPLPSLPSAGAETALPVSCVAHVVELSFLHLATAYPPSLHTVAALVAVLSSGSAYSQQSCSSVAAADAVAALLCGSPSLCPALQSLLRLLMTAQ